MQIKLRGKERKDAEAFVRHMMSEELSPNVDYLQRIALDRLLVLGQQLSKWALRECNVACRSDRERERRDAQKEELHAEIWFVCDAIGVREYELDCDPRGATIKLILPSGRYNSWDGKSWCVPTS